MNRARAIDAGRVRDALEHATGPVVALGADRWEFVLANGALHKVQARLEDDWLILSAAIGGAQMTGAVLSSVLRQNGLLPGLVKFAMDGTNTLEVRAELPLGEDIAIGNRIRQACDGFNSALNGAPAARENTPDVFPELKRLCAEAGWPITERDGGRGVVPLEVWRGSSQAVLAPRERGVYMFVDMAEFDASRPVCCEAAAALLLEASGLVRLARGAATDRGGACRMRFEAWFDQMPAPGELAAALCGLSTACALVGEEVCALEVEAAARDFLFDRGWTADESTQKGTKT